MAFISVLGQEISFDIDDLNTITGPMVVEMARELGYDEDGDYDDAIYDFKYDYLEDEILRVVQNALDGIKAADHWDKWKHELAQYIGEED